MASVSWGWCVGFWVAATIAASSAAAMLFEVCRIPDNMSSALASSPYCKYLYTQQARIFFQPKHRLGRHPENYSFVSSKKIYIFGSKYGKKQIIEFWKKFHCQQEVGFQMEYHMIVHMNFHSILSLRLFGTTRSPCTARHRFSTFEPPLVSP